MIRFETHIGQYMTGIEEVQSEDLTFFNITNKAYQEEVKQIVQRGAHYGYIKIVVDGEDLFERYHVQVVQAQWLLYIEILERFLRTDYVIVGVPITLELKRIDTQTLSFKVKDAYFVFSYREFIERLIMAAIVYFEFYEQLTNDKIYEEVLVHVKELQLQFHQQLE